MSFLILQRVLGSLDKEILTPARQDLDSPKRQASGRVGEGFSRLGELWVGGSTPYGLRYWTAQGKEAS